LRESRKNYVPSRPMGQSGKSNVTNESSISETLLLNCPPQKGRVGFQRVNVTTEVSNSEIAAPDNVWVGPGK
jgi:hypothetical protein